MASNKNIPVKTKLDIRDDQSRKGTYRYISSQGVNLTLKEGSARNVSEQKIY